MYKDIKKLYDSYRLDFFSMATTQLMIMGWDEAENLTDEEIEQLTDSTERLNDFLKNVSHELRTPVNAVIGLTGVNFLVELGVNMVLAPVIVRIINAIRKSSK